MDSKFEEWYTANRSYYDAKHEKDEEKMRDDAISTYQLMLSVAASPIQKGTVKPKKKKPNPYGF